jgi:hypothetical protein
VLEQVDWIMPMEYTELAIQPIEITGAIDRIETDHFGIIVFPILRGWNNDTGVGGTPMVEDLRRDIGAAKAAGSTGVAVFTYEAVLGAAGVDTLKKLNEELKSE